MRQLRWMVGLAALVMSLASCGGGGSSTPEACVWDSTQWGSCDWQ